MSRNARIIRDGTNQTERISTVLKPDYVQIDERSRADLLRFTYQLADQIAYYHHRDNEQDGNWQNFFPEDADIEALLASLESRANIEPNLALFLAFLKLYGVIQGDINQLTEKHLDYYYKKLLGFSEKAAEPDRVHLVFELNKNTESFKLEEGTQLKAGKEDNGLERLYETIREKVFNQAKVSELKSIFVDKDDQYRIYAAPIANSLDGLGEELDEENPTWKLFGESQKDLNAGTRTMEDAEIGFAISSPMLLLKEGSRELVIDLEFVGQPADSLGEPFLEDAFTVYLTGEKGWLDPKTLSGQIFTFKTQKVVTNPTSGNTTTTISLKQISHDTGQETTTTTTDETDYDAQEVFRTIVTSIYNPTTGSTSVTTQGPFLMQTVNIPLNAPADSFSIQKKMRMVLNLSEDDPAVLPFSSEIHESPLTASWPVLRAVLNHDANQYAYESLSALELEKIHLDLNVKGVRNLILQNDQSPLDPSKKFLPFGTNPEKGSSFYIGSHEVFQKALNDLTLHFEWADLPEDENGFNDYYSAYGAVFNTSFTANVEVLKSRSWQGSAGLSDFLFTENAGGALASDHDFSIPNIETLITGANSDLEDFDRFDNQLTGGFMRLVLNSPDFKHKEFTNLYTNQVVKKALAEDQSTADGIELPNVPYTPAMNAISLDYSSAVSIDLRNTNEAEEWFQIEPFGFQEITKGTTDFLLPQFDKEGYFYIGLTDFDPPQNISLLLQIQEGSGNPDIELALSNINWAYLSGSQWKSITDEDLIAESTLGFQQPGIVELAVEKDAADSHSRLDANLHWIRAEATTGTAGASKMIAVYAQAAAADLILDPNNTGEATSNPKTLEAETISKLLVRQGAVKKIQQPYSSFDGKSIESSELLFARVSERLRHKNRPVSLWDFEHFVLEAFPSIFKVKALPHARKMTDGSYEYRAPGYATLLLISNLRSKNGVNPLEPRTSVATIREVQNYVAQYNSHSIQVFADNPIYETITIDAKIRFLDGLDEGFYAAELNNALIRYLSPWAFEEGEDITFDEQIYKSDILAFIENQDYVDFVTELTLYHGALGDSCEGIGEMGVDVDFIIEPPQIGGIGDMILGDTFIIGRNVEVAVASDPRAILVSAASHYINPIQLDEVACKKLDYSGIGFWSLGIDFIVSPDEFIVSI